MASLGTIIFKGKSGKEYTFNIYNLDSSWDEIAVVYVVTRAEPKPNGGNTHQVIYIGETDNLKERFSNHHKQSCFDKNKANRLCTFHVIDNETRLAIESDLIGSHDTPCND